MQIMILSIEGCPHAQTMRERVASALTELGVPDTPIGLRVVTTSDDAAMAAFAGSPTLLVDDRDPFPSSGPVAALACRVYPTPEGPEGAPTVQQLRRVLTR